MRINFVLIDAENVKPEYIEKLKHEHFRVVVFVAASLKRLDFTTVNAIQSLGSNGSYIQISSVGPSLGLTYCLLHRKVIRRKSRRLLLYRLQRQRVRSTDPAP